MHSSHRRSVLASAGSLVILFLFLFISFCNFNPTHPPVPRVASGSTQPDNLQDVYNETLGFQKIFVINLPSRTDHRDAMSLAAAFTGMQIEYVDGVTEVDERTLPPGGTETALKKGSYNAWRAHMNVLRTIVEQNLTSALILEDDADWDLRLKSQLHSIALATRMLIQPLAGTSDQFLDPTHAPLDNQQQQPRDIPLDAVPRPSPSPYGDPTRWSLLWLGHCGAHFPSPPSSPRILLRNDTTVPAPHHLDPEYGSAALAHAYPAHTRVVHRARGNTCTLGYGVSQAGARALLHELGLRRFTASTDLMVRGWCDGDGDGDEGRARATCLTVQPQVFQHHRAVGRKAGYSDIEDHGEGWNGRAFSMNVRWSTRLNLGKLVRGEEDWVDLFKDGEPKTGLGT